MGIAFLLLLFVALGIGLPIFMWVSFNKGKVLRFETQATPEEVQMVTVGQVGASKGWATVSQSANNISMSYIRQPNILVAFLIFITCVGFFWAFLYWVIVSKKESLTVLISTSPSGNSAVQVTSNGYKGRRAGEAIRDALGVSPTSTVVVDAGTMPSVPGATPAAPGLNPGMSQGALPPPSATGMLPPPNPATLLGAPAAAAAPVPAAPAPPAPAPAAPAPPVPAAPVPPAPVPPAPVAPAPPAPAPQPEPQPVPQAGWFDDPHDPSLYRYFDGMRWTEHRRPR